ncbi:hypothetical protein C5614_23960 [Massilia phosphatilytica]|nr:hypothetical protein C5614_23960 [Massilia phosphatilytica]
MRKAFIGLSTPIGFDYQNMATMTSADTTDSPNPILDSPFGLLLLYDELVFLSRSLCPENMRHLPYVSFLDDDERLASVSKEEMEAAWRSASMLPYGDAADVDFSEVIANAGLRDGMGVDNHSHALRIGPANLMANADAENMAIDALMCSRLGDPDLELVTNSRLQPWLQRKEAVEFQALLAQMLVIENIPNYLTPQGPYHPVIDEVRANKYLADFRKWISQQSGVASAAEVKEHKEEVEHALRDAQENLFLKHLDAKRHYQSVGKAMLGDAVGLLFPLTGTVTAVAETGANLWKPDALRWQGFVVGARRSTRQAFAKPAR